MPKVLAGVLVMYIHHKNKGVKKMALSYDNEIKEWQNEGTEPSSDLIESGFEAGYKPPASVFNWFWNKVTKCINELQTKLNTVNSTLSNYLPLSGGTMTGAIKTNGNNIDFGSTGKATNVKGLTGERITLTSSDDEAIQSLKVRNDRIDFLKDTSKALSAAYISTERANFEVPLHVDEDSKTTLNGGVNHSQ